MHLSKLLGKQVKNDILVTHVVDDSRAVKPGSIFVWDTRIMPGKTAEYIESAFENGAILAVINDKSVRETEKIVFHRNLAEIMVRYAQSLYPDVPPVITAITGTNGKTSICWFYRQLMLAANVPVGMLGTFGVYVNDQQIAQTGYTSPRAEELHRHLSEMAKAGVRVVCLEASSHALELGRLDGISFTAAGLSNITRDHLDFHGTMEAYTAAKYRLFSELLDVKGHAVLNIVRPESWPLAALCKERGVDVLNVGVGQSELVVKPVECHHAGMTLEVAYERHRFKVDVPLIGAFQAENVALAAGLALKSGLRWEDIVSGMKTLKSVPGRMEIFTVPGRPTVVVDYAHTSDALEVSLKAVRAQTSGSVWVVFGCGGDRDAGKRPEMGRIAATLADHVVVTDDNPRFENAQDIRDEIMVACPQAKNIADRQTAISYALSHAGEGDIILVAGKGHEVGQYVAGKIIAYDERQTVEALLKEAS